MKKKHQSQKNCYFLFEFFLNLIVSQKAKIISQYKVFQHSSFIFYCVVDNEWNRMNLSKFMEKKSIRQNRIEAYSE